MLQLLDDGVLDPDILNVAHKLTRKRKPFHYVYIFRANGLCKIGRSNNPQWRKTQLQVALPYPIEVVLTIQTRQHGLEHALHSRFITKRKRGEWYDLDEEDIQWIKGFGESLAAA